MTEAGPEQQPPETTEAEEAEEAAEEEGQPEPQPEPPPVEPSPETEPSGSLGASPEDWEKRWQKADKAFAAYTRRISDIYEEDAADLVPVSVSPSAPPGFIYGPDAGRVPDEMQQPILSFFGLARPVALKQDPHTRTCPVCDGEGELETGSHVPENRKHECGECKGYGYVPPPERPENGRTRAGMQLAPVGQHTEPVATEDRDSWQEPRLLPDGRENPNFGRMPQHKVPVPPWGVTAGLTAHDAVAESEPAVTP